ncbi:MAG: Hsp20/alpha crystallin family protein [Candidatus Heimdallarchaeota archaeon]|nr:MAG: Hsp20/alpha crystallin family protein [Candidatus Heimdallarchaeota archaeon]
MKPEKHEEDIDIDIETDKHPDLFNRRMMRMDCCPPDQHMKRVFVRKFKEGKKMRRMLRHSVLTHFEEEDDKTIMFTVLPGLDKSSLSVKAKKRAILIEGEYLTEAQKIFGEKFSKRIRIPIEVDPENIDASYSAGILKLVFLGIVDPAVPIEVTSDDE